MEYVVNNYIIRTIIGCLLIIPQVKAYNLEFRNFVPRVLTIEMMLAGGIDEHPEQITVPPAIQDSSGNLIRQGIATKEFGGLRSGLCLNMKSFKIAERGQELKYIRELGGLRLTIPVGFSDNDAYFKKVLNGKMTLDFLLNNKSGFGASAWRFLRPEEVLLCYNRIIAIFEIDGKLSMMTWE